MSDIKEDGHGRARRRAVRSVGPPVEGGADAKPGAGCAGVAGSASTGGSAIAEPASARSRDVVDGTAGPAAAGERAAGSSDDAVGTGSVADESEEGSAGDTPNVDTEAGSPGAVSVDAEPASKRSVGRMLTVAAAAVLVLVMLGGAVGSLLLTRAADQREERRSAYVQTARQAVLNLTTIRADSAKEDIDRILSLASGQFRSEFDGRVDPFMSIVQQAKVVSNGEVVEAAVQSDDEDSAQVLVAAKQTLTNAGQAEPQTRYYRFRVTVTSSDSGLTASKVEFVA
ncbi:hypothetical protein [Nocardia bovistercoris]|uniref:Mce-associated membrane protein n=1 Tax=Nocardia bovistercoris TaxID=2785916 RepID=A0A931IJN9_9NOCA|nr:hypothetical protein [Nocardia bovistercoris]MBH0781530.1 hypothetical protein [Nocardia bovistercoris]